MPYLKCRLEDKNWCNTGLLSISGLVFNVVTVCREVNKKKNRYAVLYLASAEQYNWISFEFF